MTKTDSDKSILGEWLRSNLFGLINLVLIIATFAYNYGVMSSKLTALELKTESNQKQITDIQLYGTTQRPAYEARLVALEKKTDDLAVLKNIVQTQSENIRQLTDTVRADPTS